MKKQNFYEVRTKRHYKKYYVFADSYNDAVDKTVKYIKENDEVRTDHNGTLEAIHENDYVIEQVVLLTDIVI